MTLESENRIIAFSPTQESVAHRAYYDKYVFPLGNVRLGFRGSQKGGLIVRCNSAGAMQLVWVTAYVASEPKGGWEFLPKELMEKGTWIGDSEPDSDWAGVWVTDQEKQRESRFEYVPPKPAMHKGTLRLEWKAQARLRVEVTGSKVLMYGILGNPSGLHSLGMHLATLAQDEVPVGTRITYRPGKELEKKSLPLTIEKAQFQEGVPWEPQTPQNPSTTAQGGVPKTGGFLETLAHSCPGESQATKGGARENRPPPGVT